MNKIKVNKLEIIPTANAVGTAAQQPFIAQPTQQQIFTQQQAYAQQIQQPIPSPQQQEETDDLPF